MKRKLLMNTILSIFLSAMLFTSCGEERKLPDPGGKFERYQTDLQMHSNILNADILYSVYLPADYVSNPSGRYPVVYLLHGLGDDHHSWNDKYLNISSLIDQLEKQENLPPMIYIMPQGFRTYYVNKYDGSYRYMDMFTQELIPNMDKSFRTIAGKSQRAVAGYSMGGFGAMILASKNPGLFAVSVPLSMSFRTDEQYISEPGNGWNQQWGAIFGSYGASGEARLTDYYKQHCPFYLFNTQDAGKFSEIRYFFDCGDDEEQLLVANDDLHVLLRDLQIAHEYRVRNGGHQSEYWRNAMREALPFIANCFQGKSYSEEETISVPSNYSAVKESVTLSSIPVEVYLPEIYATTPEQSYPAVYFIYEDNGKLLPGDAMKIINDIQVSKPFVLITCATASLSNLQMLMEAAATKYRIKPDAEHTVAIAYGDGGKLIYEASSAATSPFSALFFVDSDLGNLSVPPRTDVFYYITITDEGKNYPSANSLYKWCHEKGVPFEYRVHNGLATTLSSQILLDKLKYTLQDKIKK